MNDKKSYVTQFTELLEQLSSLPVGEDYNKVDITGDYNETLLACLQSFLFHLSRVERAFCHILLEAPDGGVGTVVGQKLASFLNEVAKNIPRIGGMLEAVKERNGLKSVAGTIKDMLAELRNL